MEFTIENCTNHFDKHVQSFVYNYIHNPLENQGYSYCDFSSSSKKWIILINPEKVEKGHIALYFNDSLKKIQNHFYQNKYNLAFFINKEDVVICLTQDGAKFEISKNKVIHMVEKLMKSKFYKTKEENFQIILSPEDIFVLNNYPKHPDVEFNRIYGTFAIKKDNNSFITTTRGKYQGQNSYSIIKSVDHTTREIIASTKATLNAPLLDYFFKKNPSFRYIIHGHDLEGNVYHNDYEFPGTDRDNLFAHKVSSGEKILLPHHGYIVGFESFNECEKFLKGEDHEC